MNFDLKSIRFLRIASALLLLLSTTQWISAECTIEFDHPSETLISTQYLSCGVFFEGEVGDPPPWVYDYIEEPGRILTSHDWYAPIIVRFVEPSNINQYRPVSYIEFDIPTGDSDWVTVDVYNASDTLIDTIASISGSPETIALNYDSPTAAYIVIDDVNNSTAFAIDNMTVHRQPNPIFRDRFLSNWHFRWSHVEGLLDPI